MGGTCIPTGKTHLSLNASISFISCAFHFILLALSTSPRLFSICCSTVSLSPLCLRLFPRKVNSLTTRSTALKPPPMSRACPEEADSAKMTLATTPSFAPLPPFNFSFLFSFLSARRRRAPTPFPSCKWRFEGCVRPVKVLSPPPPPLLLSPPSAGESATRAPRRPQQTPLDSPAGRREGLSRRRGLSTRHGSRGSWHVAERLLRKCPGELLLPGVLRSLSAWVRFLSSQCVVTVYAHCGECLWALLLTICRCYTLVDTH